MVLFALYVFMSLLLFLIKNFGDQKVNDLVKKGEKIKQLVNLKEILYQNKNKGIGVSNWLKFQHFFPDQWRSLN